ncbi:MAG: hypothetical protein NZM33_00615 [Bryobacteraceae bacterium]|nr:hypothetical protein [Bryobacteraceae bacterium]
MSIATMSEGADMVHSNMLAEPRAQWEVNPAPAPLDARPVRAWIDYVRFADQTEWGPDE